MSIFFNAVTKPASYPNYLLGAGHVIFGAPSRTCLGNGICKVYSIHAAARLNIPCELVQVKLALTKNYLILCIPVENCSQQLIRQQFSGTHFILEEDFQLPHNFLKLIQETRACVRSGCYSYEEQNGYIWVDLPYVTI